VDGTAIVGAMGVTFVVGFAYWLWRGRASRRDGAAADVAGPAIVAGDILYSDHQHHHGGHHHDHGGSMDVGGGGVEAGGV
jgi:hypothetical protein